MTQNFTTIRTLFRDQILTISGWSESPFPMELLSVDEAPDQPAAPVTNRNFAVGLSQIVDRHESRSRAAEHAIMACNVSVRLLHRVVPSQRMTSADTAWDDAQAVFIALMQQSTPWSGDVLVGFDGMTRGASASGEWIVTDLNFTAQWAMLMS